MSEPRQNIVCISNPGGQIIGPVSRKHILVLRDITLEAAQSLCGALEEAHGADMPVIVAIRSDQDMELLEEAPLPTAQEWAVHRAFYRHTLAQRDAAWRELEALKHRVDL